MWKAKAAPKKKVVESETEEEFLTQVKTTKVKTTWLSVVVMKWEAMTTLNLNMMTKIKKK